MFKRDLLPMLGGVISKELLRAIEDQLTVTKVWQPGPVIITSDEVDNASDAVLSVDVVFPTSPATGDGLLFELGGNGVGFYMGLRNGGTVFRVRCGAGGPLPDSEAAWVDISDFPRDGRVHRVLTEINVSNALLRVFIDNQLSGSHTAASDAFKNNIWTGNDDGGFSLVNNATVGEPTIAWPGVIASGMRYYANQRIASTPQLGLFNFVLAGPGTLLLDETSRLVVI